MKRSLSGRVAARVIAAAIALLVAAITAVSAGAAPHAAAGHSAKGLSNAVTVTRDGAGVAHIVARNFTALGYGEGDAFAQDNLCTFANDIVTVEGNRSKYFGPKGLAIGYAAGVSDPNIDSDLFWRYIQATGIVKRALTATGMNGLLPQVRQLYTGWVDGYNAYLRSGKLRDPSCKGKPWVHPITLADMILRGEQIVTLPSSQQFISGIVGAAPPAAGAHVARSVAAGTVPTKAGLEALAHQFDASDRAEGSNGIGLGAQDTRSRTGMVLANPHFPWRGTERFWMAQLDVPSRPSLMVGYMVK